MHEAAVKLKVYSVPIGQMVGCYMLSSSSLASSPAGSGSSNRTPGWGLIMRMLASSGFGNTHCEVSSPAKGATQTLDERVLQNIADSAINLEVHHLDS